MGFGTYNEDDEQRDAEQIDDSKSEHLDRHEGKDETDLGDDVDSLIDNL